jgi:hypothetical protein
MPIPTWVTFLIGLVESVDPTLAPFIQFGLDTYTQLVSNPRPYTSAFTLDPIPASMQGTKGNWTVTWTPS